MSAGENFSCSYSPAGFTAPRRSSSPAAICPADTLSGYSSSRRSPDGAAYISRPTEWHMPCSGRQTRWDNAVRERCGQTSCTRRRGTTRPCPAENKTSCAPVSAAGTRFSPRGASFPLRRASFSVEFYITPRYNIVSEYRPSQGLLRVHSIRRIKIWRKKNFRRNPGGCWS